MNFKKVGRGGAAGQEDYLAIHDLGGSRAARIR